MNVSEIYEPTNLAEAKVVYARVQQALEKDWDLALAREAEMLVMYITAHDQDTDVKLSAADRWLGLTKVPVWKPPYQRLNPKTGKLENVDAHFQHYEVDLQPDVGVPHALPTQGPSIIGTLDKETIDYPPNWNPGISDVGKRQEGRLPTSYVAGLVKRYEPDLQTWREYDAVPERKKEFLESVKREGVKEQLLVYVNPPDNKYDKPRVQVEGQRRLMAAIAAGLPDVPVEVRYFGNTHALGDDLFRGRLAGDPDVHAPTEPPRPTIMRGLVAGPDGGIPPDVTDRLLAGTATADDVLSLIDTQQIGEYWYSQEEGMSLEDAEELAWDEETPAAHANAREDWKLPSGNDIASVGVVLVGAGPPGWSSENNPAGLMGNSYLPNGTVVPLKEIRYNAGDGWHSIPAEGREVHLAPDDPADVPHAIPTGGEPYTAEVYRVSTKGQTGNGLGSRFGTGSYYVTDAEGVDFYKRLLGGYGAETEVTTTTVHLRNPLRVDNPTMNGTNRDIWDAAGLGREGGTPEEITAGLKAAGYDGIVIRDHTGTEANQVVVFESDQPHAVPTGDFASLLAERRKLAQELQDLEADAPNPRDGNDFIARRDAYYARKDELQKQMEALTVRMNEVRGQPHAIPTAPLKWKRETDGYRSGNWFIRRHVDDDPGNAYGAVTQWAIEDNGSPVDMATSLADAKRAVGRMQDRRDQPHAIPTVRDLEAHPEGNFTPDREYQKATWAEIPDKVYHVAPGSQRQSINEGGLDATGHTFNLYRADSQWENGRYIGMDDNPTTSDYRPEGVYTVAAGDTAASLARDYAEKRGEPQDIWEIDVDALRRDQASGVIRDPEIFLQNWEEDADLPEDERVYATPEEAFESQRTFGQELGAEYGSDYRSWVFEQIPRKYLKRVEPYEVKPQDQWDDDDQEAYMEAHPEEFADDEEFDPGSFHPDFSDPPHAIPAAPVVPVLPGETPIPEGEVRLFHRTSLRNLESIRKNGLTVASAKGESYGEPNVVWASSGTNSAQAKWVTEGSIMDTEMMVVEFHMPVGKLDIGSKVGSYTDEEWAKSLESRNSDVTIYGDVPPENIIAIHEPWHAAYRTLSGPDYIDQVKAGEYDNFLDDPQFPGYSKALKIIKAEQPHAIPTDPHHGAGPWYHGTNADLKPGDIIRPGETIGQQSHGEFSDNTRVWVSNVSNRAGAYGSRVYLVEPEGRPKSPYANGDEHYTAGARVIRELTTEEIRNGVHAIPTATTEITPEARADVVTYGRGTFMSVDRSIALHSRLGITEPWNEWERPRRLAALETPPEVQVTPEGFAAARAAVKERLSDEQFNALSFFTSGNGYNVTFHLRAGDEQSGRFEYRGMKASEVAPILDTAFATAGLTLPTRTTLYRGGGEERFGMFNNAEVGEVVPDPSFMSTSIDRSLGEHFVKKRKGGLVVIDAPQGTPVLVGTGIEKEVILPRGSRFRVMSKEPGVVHVRLEPDAHAVPTATAWTPAVHEISTTKTLYRGEGSHDHPSYYPETGPSAQAGQWWTDNLESARRYAASTKGGQVYEIQVTDAEVEAHGLPGYYLIPDPEVRDRRRLLDAPKIDLAEVHFEGRGDAVPGGYNGSWFAKAPDGTVLGRIDYETASHDPNATIAYIDVPDANQHQGVGTLLVHWLQDNTEGTLDWGMTTPEGEALRRSMEGSPKYTPLSELSDSYLRELAAQYGPRAIQARAELESRRKAAMPTGPTPTFTSLPDASQYVEARYGYADFSGYGPAQLPALQSTIEQADRIVAEYPFLQTGVSGYTGIGGGPWTFRGIGTGKSPELPARVREFSGQAWGVTDNSPDGPKVWFMPEASDFDRGTGMLGEIGFLAETTPAETMTHEMGHVVASVAGEDRIDRALDYAKAEVYSKLKKPERGFMNDLGSIYAGDKNGEAWAELFFRLNYPSGLDGLSKLQRSRLLQLQKLINAEIGFKVI